MYQQTTILGNVGRTPELRYLQNGTAVCDFSVAVNERYTKQDGTKVENTTWFKVTAWRGLAETVAKYITSGRQVMVVGAVKASAYLDKSGQPAATLELTAAEIKFVGGSKGEGNGAQHNNDDSFASDTAGRVDDIPF